MKIVFFADGSSSIGSGHVIRSLVLAAELRAFGHEVAIVGEGVTQAGRTFASFSGIETRRSTTGCGSMDLEQATTGGLPDLVVVDGYHYGSSSFRALEQLGVAHGVIDDVGTTKATRPRFILNCNANASKALYSVSHPESTLLLGIRYSLVRREIRAYETIPWEERKNTIFVSFGGSDVTSITGPVMHELAGSGMNVSVAIGPNVADRESVLGLARRTSGVSVIDQRQYEESLAQSSFAVLASGSSLLEAAALGIPTIGVLVADNQVAPARALSDRWRGLVLVDGRGNEAPIVSIRQALRKSLREPVGVDSDEISSIIKSGPVRAAKAILALL